MIEKYAWHLPKLKLNKVYKEFDYYDTKYLSINIVTINQPDYLRKCLESVYKTTPQDFPASEIHIWENGSPKEIQEVVKQAIKDAGTHPSFVVHWWPHDENIGFAAAHNKMVRLSAGKYLCMLNDDMEIFEQNWASLMISHLSAQTVQVGGWNEAVCNQLDSIGHGFGSRPHLTEYIDGAFVMMNMQWARAFGPWDTETFKFAYCEDPDLSIRIRSMGLGIKIVYINHVHHRAKTTSKITQFDLQGISTLNRIKLLNKWDYYFSHRDFWVRIAVVRTAAAGDVLMSTSVVAKIRELAPEAVIDVFTAFPIMYANNTRVNNVYHIKDWQEHRSKYHCIVMLTDSYEKDTNELSFRAYYKVAGMEDEEIMYPEIYFTQEELDEADRIIADHKKTFGDKPIVVFHTGKTNWSGRNLPLDRFVSAAKYMQLKGYSVIEVGGLDTDKMDVQSTQLQGTDMSVKVTMAIISKADFFIGIDSFPWNVAQAFKVPSLVTFGCIDPKTRVLDPKITTALQSTVKSCIGCHHLYTGPVHESKCLRVNGARVYSAPCMEDITADMIIRALNTKLKEPKKMSETAKIRDKVAEYISPDKIGIDIGCGPDKLYKSTLGWDRYKTPVVDFVGDARVLPFEDGEFDYVFSSHCLEDFLDKENVLKEWCRIIKPGGKIALYLPHKDYYKGCNVDHYELFDSSYIKPILESIGFTIDLDFLDIGDYNGVKDDRYSFLVVATKNGQVSTT